MEQYISKAALIAEIERRIEENKAEIQRATHKHLEEYFEGYEDALVLFKEKFLDTLEVKEVDLEAELSNYIKHYRSIETGYTIFGVAKYFFELGLSVSNNAQKGE